MRELLEIFKLNLLDINNGFLSVVIKINCWIFIDWLICLELVILNSNLVSILLFRDFKLSICIFYSGKIQEKGRLTVILKQLLNMKKDILKYQKWEIILWRRNQKRNLYLSHLHNLPHCLLILHKMMELYLFL